MKFQDRMNILVGRNASGKTSILEAIYVLGTTKSHRTSTVKELISYESDGFYIKGEAHGLNSSFIVEIGCPRKGKRILKLNNDTVRLRRDLVGKIPVVFFSPEDLNIVKADPSFRRKFLDIMISQLSLSYLVGLQKYQRVLLERNNALKQIKTGRLEKKMLDVWDEQLIRTGVEIVRKREEIIDRLKELCRAIHERMTGGSERLDIHYKTGTRDAASFEKALGERKEAEIQQGITMSGPHRDDILIRFNGTEMREYGSQGQHRTAALSLKLAELELMREIKEEYPLILFDDVMSELDRERRSFFLDILTGGERGSDIQSFITTTEEGLFGNKGEGLNIIRMQFTGG